MEYKLLKEEKEDLRVSDLIFDDYFIFKNKNTIEINPNAIFKLVDNHSYLGQLYALSFSDNTVYPLKDDLGVKVTKVKPIKIENDIMYFTEI